MKTRILLTALVVFAGINVSAQSHKANVEKSTVKWTGTKVVGSSHDGFIKLSEGELEVKDDKIASGQFVIDMNSITNTDLDNKDYNQKLVGHLKSDDFFGVATYPTAKLEIRKASAFNNNKASVKADLTIKGQTKPIAFEVEKKDNAYVASIVVDRTLYGIRYGSGSFFDNLGDKAISNDFTLDVQLVLE
ncbi:YceI family protein [Carboxylicivirga sp. RSCT41]|uniref:YceI family protein n=1 Tax=Carboxylicivirga agarovorans TaxID=3417570 RepID=UPI003D34DB88